MRLAVLLVGGGVTTRRAEFSDGLETPGLVEAKGELEIR